MIIRHPIWCWTWERHPASGLLAERLTAEFGPGHARGVTIRRAVASRGLDVEVVAVQLGSREARDPLHDVGVGDRFTIGDLLEWIVDRYRRWLGEQITLGL